MSLNSDFLQNLRDLDSIDAKIIILSQILKHLLNFYRKFSGKSVVTIETFHLGHSRPSPEEASPASKRPRPPHSRRQPPTAGSTKPRVGSCAHLPDYFRFLRLFVRDIFDDFRQRLRRSLFIQRPHRPVSLICRELAKNACSARQILRLRSGHGLKKGSINEALLQDIFFRIRYEGSFRKDPGGSEQKQMPKIVYQYINMMHHVRQCRAPATVSMVFRVRDLTGRNGEL